MVAAEDVGVDLGIVQPVAQALGDDEVVKLKGTTKENVDTSGP